MNRRDFLTSLAALSAAPLAAHPALASATHGTKVPPMLYLHAKFQAERFGPPSVAALTRTLGISPATASAISTKLLRAGITAAPAAPHIRKLTKPNLRETVQNLAGKAQKLDELTQTEDDPSPLT